MRGFALALLALAGCTSPSFGNGHLQCASSGRVCPASFYCAADAHCWRNGTGPDAGSSDDDMSAPSDLASTLDDLATADLAITPSKCAAAGALLCESFESPTALSNWTVMAPNGFLQRDTTHAYRGTASLHANITGAAVNTSPRSVLSETSTFPINTTIYVRVWAYFPSPAPATFDQPINFLTSTTGGVTEGIDNGFVTINDYASPAYYRSSAASMPLDRWTCLQFDMNQSSAMGPIHLTLDGVPLNDIAATNVATPAMAYFGVGLDFYANTVAIPQYDAWFDEIIFDDKPTTCAE
jgi:hypothetical protein